MFVIKRVDCILVWTDFVLVLPQILRTLCHKFYPSGYFASKEKSHNLYQSLYELRCEKTCLWGFQPGPTQTGLYNHTRMLEA